MVQIKTARTDLPNTREPSKRLRVAFLSPDLRDHSVAYFFEPLLRHLDPAEFEIYLYHDHFSTDAVSRRLQSHAAQWRNFVGQADRTVEEQILQDAPDILVEMAGHSGFNRMPMLAGRVAPIEISYLGYPNTTGVPTIDYRFTDAIADPFSDGDAFATERLVRLPTSAWTYQPPDYAPVVAAAPCTRDRPFTFGTFNNLAKLNVATFALWSDVLRAVPGSRLLIKGYFSDEEALLRMAKEGGIEANRIWLAGPTKTAREHLDAYSNVDVALDPFPYSGTTTTCEALWMGVPVITLFGDRHSSRVGASLLTTVGHKEWVAYHQEEYVRIAQSLAGNPARLATIRAELRPEMLASALLDHAGQAQRFGAALRNCWIENSAPAMPLPQLAGSALPIDFLTG